MTCLALAGNADDVAQLTALQQMASQIGVNLKIEQFESATRLARFKAGDYEVRTSLWTKDVNDPSKITWYFCYYPIVQCNHSGWRDAAIEKVYVASQSDAPIVFLLEVPYPVGMLRRSTTSCRSRAGTTSSWAPTSAPGRPPCS